nr:AMP-binding protein [Candidatus Njordarchaeum guaymaensis]
MRWVEHPKRDKRGQVFMTGKDSADLYGDQILRSWRKGLPSSWVEPDRPWNEIAPKNFPRTLDYPEVPLFEICDQAAHRFKNKISIRMIPQDHEYTYSNLKNYSDRFASALSDHFNARKGSSIAIITWNSPEYVFSLFGVLKTGASCTLINPLVPTEDVRYIINGAEIIDTAIVDETVCKKVQDVEGIENLITIGENEIEGTETFWNLVQASEPRPPSVKIDPKNDMAALIYTGGTTGKPKGVVLTHFNLVANALQCAYFGRQPSQVHSALGKGVTLIVLPICHISGFTMLLTAIYEGHTNIMTHRFDVQEICEAIDKYKVTKFPVVPTLLSYLINYPDLAKYDFSSIQICGSGAFPLPPEMAKKFEETTHVKVVQGYGLTEMCAAASTNPIWDPKLIKPGSVGIPIVDTDLKVVDPDTEKELPLEEIGEAWWRGPQLMKEYWKAPEITRNTLKDGWLRSGDLVKIDKDGYVYLVERLKDIIKYKGYKIFPDEIESKLQQHPAVMECAVIGIKDPSVGEVVKAFVVLKKQLVGKVAEQEIMDWSREKLGPIKYPRAVEFCKDIPKSLVGKPSRKLLRQREP